MADPVYFLPAWLREIGAIAGLLTLTIGTIDRLFSGRLLCSISIGEHGATLLLSNPSRVDATIIGWRVVPKIYGVARTSSVRAIAYAVTEEQFSVAVRAGDDFPLILIGRQLDGVPHADVNRRGIIIIYWRKNSSLWWPQIPVWTIFDTGLVNNIRANPGE
jgi:hypothetical protein